MTTTQTQAREQIALCTEAYCQVRPGSRAAKEIIADQDYWRVKLAAIEAIEIAARCSTWGEMASSAALCLDDAVSLINRDQHAYAYARALDSLRYSVGIFGEAYKAAKALQA